MRAMGNIQRGIIAGKLKGAMPAHTPKGVLGVEMGGLLPVSPNFSIQLKMRTGVHLWQVRSMSLLTPTRFSPINRLVTLHACSTTFLGY